jgi:hypothetical protein
MLILSSTAFFGCPELSALCTSSGTNVTGMVREVYRGRL